MTVTSRIRSKNGAGLGQVERAMAALARKAVLVGIPGDSAPRPSAPGEKGTPPSNALVGYVMEFGDDDRNIPARPFLVPGVRDALPQITKGFAKAAASAFSGQVAAIDNGLDEAGLAAQAAVKAKMIAGPFAPLSDRTIEARARRRYADTGKLVGTKSSREARAFLKLRAEGTPDAVLHEAGLVTPLLDTLSLRNSIQYSIRNKG